ncbi:MAG: DNA alkylation repair protein [Methanomassiliicoccaceae archaeon]|jgi:3-methyladenine DNA glycosylase AlkD|nr:DNA alkylation repair protein [Methanomassiliicoccaceae archaeon]
METSEEIRKRFLANADADSIAFGEKVIVPKRYRLCGLRAPVIRKFAKDICKGDWRSYLKETEDEYHEDMMLRALIITGAKMGTDERFVLIREFVPKMDNWAMCDVFFSDFKVTKDNAKEVWDFVLPYLDTGMEFQMRFAVSAMLGHFINEEYFEEVLKRIDSLKDNFYYVRMAVAWCVAECFIRFPDATMIYLKNNTLNKFTFNKALSKIADSYRIGDPVKDEIRAMRRR